MTTGSTLGLRRRPSGFLEHRDAAAALLVLSAAYGLWLPMQDDPGAFYTSVTSQIASFGLRLCFSGRCA
jgi:hypothetical protein